MPGGLVDAATAALGILASQTRPAARHPTDVERSETPRTAPLPQPRPWVDDRR
jgi:hypothetical protein